MFNFRINSLYTDNVVWNSPVLSPNIVIWAASWYDQQKDLCAQRRLRSVWASIQSDQSLSCRPEETFGPQLSIGHTAKTVIRLGGCPGWSESSLGAQPLCLFRHEAAHVLKQKNTAPCSHQMIVFFFLSVGHHWSPLGLDPFDVESLDKCVERFLVS